MELFLRYPQHVLSRGAIIDHLWSFEETPVEGSVTNLIKDLRHRLKAAGLTAELIETVYGMGYRLRPVPEDDWNDREQRVRTIIQQVAERFQVSLEQRMAVLQSVERSLQAGTLSAQQQTAARLQAHKLAGGLGTFGYVKASKIAEAIEHLLEAPINQETQLAQQFSQCLEDLQQALTASLAEAAEPNIARR
ncbi:winged helix-turn-helix domain-containing protein [Thermocoleostomius sinensis]|uniref:winged helix-turn-helix domain-containing protein n=1 Tax=Thermocoleostomius sinensis TaxID=3065396 RepID=UPI0028F423A0|nr:winged helix-turn-helix domain-containing protein [Thermocoleostomius sinensis]